MNRKPKIPDFPIILSRINGAGLSLREIAEETGTSLSAIEKVKNEKINIPDGWETAYRIIDLYLRNVKEPFPFFGEHNN